MTQTYYNRGMMVVSTHLKNAKAKKAHARVDNGYTIPHILK